MADVSQLNANDVIQPNVINISGESPSNIDQEKITYLKNLWAKYNDKKKKLTIYANYRLIYLMNTRSGITLHIAITRL